MWKTGGGIDMFGFFRNKNRKEDEEKRSIEAEILAQKQEKAMKEAAKKAEEERLKKEASKDSK